MGDVIGRNGVVRGIASHAGDLALGRLEDADGCARVVNRAVGQDLRMDLAAAINAYV